VESQLDVLFRVADRLETARIPYMITGSIALNFYAEPRMTRDVDIVIELHASQADAFAAAFADEFYCEVQAVRRAVAHRKMFKHHSPHVRQWAQQLGVDHLLAKVTS
jgi:hypothetical protein